MPANDDRLEFTYRATSKGEVAIYHGGRLATTLRGKPAQTFLTKAERASHEGQQQLMQRLTGNYKHGNERQARSHPRNWA